MAAVVAHHPMDSPHGSLHSPPHGTKRAADGALDGEQRLSKRFDLLNLDHTNRGRRLHMAVPSSSHAATTPRPDAVTTPPRPPTSHDSMQVDDTPHRVYIHDLAAELSDTDTDSDSDHPIFLPDIEKHLSRIPPHVLRGPPPKPTAHNQMVLYSVPESLTLPKEHDSVRKAIVEARQRLREQQASPVTDTDADTDTGSRGAAKHAVDDADKDADAMDVD